MDKSRRAFTHTTADDVSSVVSPQRSLYSRGPRSQDLLSSRRSSEGGRRTLADVCTSGEGQELAAGPQE